MNKIPLECKHVSAYAKEEEITTRYYPQVQQQMLLTGAPKAYLSVFFGTLKYKIFEIEADPIYQAALTEQTRKFMECVQTGELPVAVNIPVPVEAVKSVDMTGNNSWANAAGDWHMHHGPAKAFEKAAKQIKEMIEPDVMEAFGHGIRASRSKTGAITIRRQND
jgi:hypothetical protein